MEIDPKNIGLGIEELTRHSSNEDLSHESQNGASSSDEARASNLDESHRQKTTYHLRKWRRLKKHYRDQYLDFFNECCNHDPSSEDNGNLRTSQFGAVTWTSDEKKQLFAAIAQFGRHDLGQLAKMIVTKSVIEISAYINCVHQAQIDRQLFQAHPKHISIADIPAALEIGPECEAELEKAADALNAYQEQYDLTASQKDGNMPWLVDHVVASQLDAENDILHIESAEEPEEDRQEVAEQQPLRWQQLFYLSKMLESSEIFFMNHSTESPYPHWRSIAEPKQRPAMTNDCMQNLHDLVVERLRQILKVSIQVANARLSSMTSNGYSPSQKLGQSDVATALQILDMPHDAWDFWAGMARRNGQQVITGAHNKGEPREKLLSHESAEAVLLPRRARGRRRSMSVGSETSSVASNLSEATGMPPESDVEDVGEYAESVADSVESSTSLIHETIGVLEETSGYAQLLSTGIKVSDTMEDNTGTDRNKRRLLLEEELERYTEILDRAADSLEEKKLWQVLGKRPYPDAEEGTCQPGPRPKSFRKAQEELDGWSSQNMAEWEYYGCLPFAQEIENRGYDTETEAKTDDDNDGGSD